VSSDGSILVGLDDYVARAMTNAWKRTSSGRQPAWNGVGLRGPEGRIVTITALAVSPHYATDNTAFAATNAGIFVSRDGGRSFTSWGTGMDHRPVVALAVTPRIDSEQWLYALGLGGSLWRRRVAPPTERR
jgi:hypothetical protein